MSSFSGGLSDQVQRLVFQLQVDGQDAAERLLQLLNQLEQQRDVAIRKMAEEGSASKDLLREVTALDRAHGVLAKTLAEMTGASGRMAEGARQAATALDKTKASTDAAAASARRAKQDIYEFADTYEIVEDAALDATQAITSWGPAAAAASRKAEQESAKAAEAVRKVGEAAETAAGKGATHRGISGLGLAVSRFGQDAAQGFSMAKDPLDGLQRAIFNTGNNAEALMMALGATGVAGTVAVLAYTLLPALINAFKGAFGTDPVEQFASRVEELKHHIKELEDKPAKLAVDFADIERAKKEVKTLSDAKEALDALMGAQSKTEKASGSAVNAAIVETAGGLEAFEAAKGAAIRDRLGAVDVREARAVEERATAAAGAAIRKYEQARADAVGGGPVEAAAEAIARTEAEQADRAFRKAVSARENLEKQAAGEVETRFGTMLHDATQGRGVGQAQAQRQLAEALAGQGDAGRRVAARIDVARPEVIAASDQAKKVGEAVERREKARAERSRANEKALEDVVNYAMPGDTTADRLAAARDIPLMGQYLATPPPSIAHRLVSERRQAEAKARHEAEQKQRQAAEQARRESEQYIQRQAQANLKPMTDLGLAEDVADALRSGMDPADIAAQAAPAVERALGQNRTIARKELIDEIAAEIVKRVLNAQGAAGVSGGSPEAAQQMHALMNQAMMMNPGMDSQAALTFAQQAVATQQRFLQQQAQMAKAYGELYERTRRIERAVVGAYDRTNTLRGTFLPAGPFTGF